MKRFTGMLARSKSSTNTSDLANSTADSPEVNVTRAIRSFCEFGKPSDGGEEVLFLPVIVEAAESSPAASAAAAQQIRDFLGKKYVSKPHIQYNSIMLIRILADNPGPQFMRNFDKAFVSAVKECLRHSKDGGTVHMLRETLDSLEFNKQDEEGLQLLLQMWRKEKGANASLAAVPGAAGQWQQGATGAAAPTLSRQQLPPPVELASRIEEAKNSAKILLQLIQSTPSSELLGNDLIREFSGRCQMASKSMQNYINSTNPYPDDDTMQTLIETNEQLSLAGSRFQRAMLAARRAAGPVSSPPSQAPTPTPASESLFAPPPTSPSSFAPPSTAPSLFAPSSIHPSTQESHGRAPSQSSGRLSPIPMLPAIAPSSTSRMDNPFADPIEQPSASLFQSRPTQSYTIQSEPTYAPGHNPQHPTPLQTKDVPTPATYAAELDAYDAYTATPIRPEHSSDGYDVSPEMSPSRPRLSDVAAAGVTPSYIGRQDSAMRGLTMHGGNAA